MGDFGALLQMLRLKDTKGVGIGLITLPDGFHKVGLVEGVHKAALNGRRLTIQKRRPTRTIYQWKSIRMEQPTVMASHYIASKLMSKALKNIERLQKSTLSLRDSRT